MAANAGAVRAGRAFVEIFADDSRLVRGLRRAQRRLRAFGDSVQQLGLRTFALGSAMAAPFALAVKAASDAEQTMQKFRAVFRENADAADAFAKALAQSIGRAPSDIRNSMSAFQAFFVGLGFGGKQATEFSTSLQRLMHDFAAFFNISDQEAMERFISALAGSPQVLDQFGINIRAATIEQELLAMGIKKSVQEATEQEKTVARLAIIMRALTDQGAVGAAVREINTFEGQMRRLRSMIREVAVEIGNALLPVLTPLINRVGAWAEGIKRIVQRNPGLVRSVAAVAAGLIAAGAALITFGTGSILLSSTLGGIASIVTGFGNSLRFVGRMGMVAFRGVSMVVKVLTLSVGTILTTISRLVVAAATALVSGLTAGVSAAGSAFAALLTPIGAVGIALAGLAAFAVYMSGVFQNVIGGIGQLFRGLRETAVDSVQGIADALMAGNIQLAGRIAFLGLKMEWVRAVNFMEDIWFQFTNFFADVWDLAIDRAAKAIVWLETVAKQFAINLDRHWNPFGLFDQEAVNRHNAGVAARREAAGALGRQQFDQVDAITQGEMARRRREADERQAKAQKDFEQAAAEWRKAIEEARRQRQQAEQAGPGVELGGGFPRIGAGLAAAKDRASVAGTFSAAAVRGLGSATVFDKIANATEETAKNTKGMNGFGVPLQFE